MNQFYHDINSKFQNISLLFQDMNLCCCFFQVVNPLFRIDCFSVVINYNS